MTVDGDFREELKVMDKTMMKNGVRQTKGSRTMNGFECQNKDFVQHAGV